MNPLVPKCFEQHRASMPWLMERTLFLTRHGSHAYGTNTPTSDEDFKGFAIPPRSFFHGFLNRFEQGETHEPADMVVYNIRKFFELAADCNPSIVEVLWTHPTDWIICSGDMAYINSYRKDFLSKKAGHTFTGYAMSQLKRIKRHYSWLKDPPKRQPTRADFNLPEVNTVPADQRAAVNAAVKSKMAEWNGLLDWDGLDPASCIAIRGKMEQYLEEITLGVDDKLWVAAARTIGVPEGFIRHMELERGYNNAMENWNHYQTWLRQRNPARAELEAKFGYDTKHGMHLVRLMRMGYEILTTQQVHVMRPDREELVEIRNGSWPYEKMVEYAESMDAKIQEASRLSTLPRSANRAALNNVYMDIIERHLDDEPIRNLLESTHP